MVSGNQPSKAMMYVAELQLFLSVFTLPNEFDPPLPDKCDRLCVSFMRSSLRLLELIDVSLFTGDQRRLCLYAALFLPFRDTVYRENNEEKKIPVVRYICHNSLKLKSSDADAVIDLHGALHKFLSLLPFFILEHDAECIEVYWEKETVNISTSSKLRVLTGLLLRDIKGLRDISFTEPNLPELEKRKRLFKRIEDKILELGLEEVWKMKLLLNGFDIKDILGLEKGGPIVGEWKQALFRWQLAHPSGTADAFIVWKTESSTKRARTI